jgi:hypothetical protein
MSEDDIRDVAELDAEATEVARQAASGPPLVVDGADASIDEYCPPGCPEQESAEIERQVTVIAKGLSRAVPVSAVLAGDDIAEDLPAGSVEHGGHLKGSDLQGQLLCSQCGPRPITAENGR